MGEVVIQLRRVAGGNGAGERGLRLVERGDLLIILARRNRLFREQFLRALEIDFGQLQRGLGAFRLSLRPVEFRLVRPRIDGEEQVAFLHQHVRPRREVDRGDVAGDTRANFHKLDRLDAPGVFVPSDFLSTAVTVFTGSGPCWARRLSCNRRVRRSRAREH